MLPSIVTGVILFYFQRTQNRKDEERKRIEHEHYEESKCRSEARKKEGRLSLKLLMANGKLSYASAMAIKRGKPNGEMEDAMTDYEVAKKDYYNFINNEYVERIQE